MDVRKATARSLSALCASLIFCGALNAAETNPAANPPATKFVAPANDTPTMYNLTYGKPYIDVDEWRDTPRRHRYVHGGFENSHLLFSVYLPPKELYKGRFLLELEGGAAGFDKMMTKPGIFAYNETGSWEWLFNLAFDDLGAYLVETNEGHYPDEGLGTDTPKDIWEASGYGTNYVRKIAAQMYGTTPKHGYVNGCSGGGTRSSQHLENMPDLLDGAVPQAWGHLGALQWSAYDHAGALLGEKTKDVIDALEVGGSGDPFKGLDAQQADALKDMLMMGYIRDGISQLKPGWFTTPAVEYYVMDHDPEYFKDFWNKPGYAGHDNPKELEHLLIETTVTVDKVFTVRELQAAAARAQPDSDATYGKERGNPQDFKQSATIKYDGDPGKLFQATVTLLSGKDKGRKAQIISVGKDNMITPFVARDGFFFENVQPGDQLSVSNRDYIAFMHYYRHAGAVITKKMGLDTPGHPILTPELKALVSPDGKPRYVQREKGIDQMQSANFKGKMIVLSGTADEPIWPTSMTAYDKRVRKNLGDKVEDQYRMWWVHNAPHCGGVMNGPRSTVFVPNNGISAQAIRDVVKWVEDGVSPPQSTGYHFTDDNALVLAPTAKQRKGIQPVVNLAANGGLRAEVAVGEPVTFKGTGEVPPQGGKIVAAQFDFDGKGAWPEKVAAANGSSATVSATATHTYTEPGTYFATFRVGSIADGAKGDAVYDIARVRVVVQ